MTIEQHKIILNQHETRIGSIETDMNEFKTDLRVGTEVMQSIAKDLSELSKAFRDHLKIEEGRLLKALVFLLITMTSGLIGTITYIFTHQ